MGSQPTFLTTSLRVAPATPEVPHYEGVPADALLPPKGEPVYIDHPIFVNDELLADQLSVAAWFYLMVEQNEMYTVEIRETRKRWLLGEIPIPDEDLEAMLRRRIKNAPQRCIPLTRCRDDEPYPYPSEVQAELAEAEAKQAEAEAKQAEAETEQAEALLAASSGRKRVAGGLVSRMLSVFRSV